MSFSIAKVYKTFSSHTCLASFMYNELNLYEYGASSVTNQLATLCKEVEITNSLYIISCIHR